MNDPKTKLTPTQIRDAGLGDWRQVLGSLQTRFRTGDFTTGLALVDRIGAAAEEMDHHPDIVLTYPSVTVTLTSHDVGGITSRDVDLARQISEFAVDAGVDADPGSVTVVEWALDTAADAAAGSFWAAVTAGRVVESGDLAGEVEDPHSSRPNFWFQGPEEGYEPVPGEVEQRWHPDVWVAPDEVQNRIDAAVAAGGTLVDDSHAPRFWVLADPDGNRMCVCAADPGV